MATKVAILGAGHGGQAMAADLTLAGHEVRLTAVPEHSTNLQLLTAFGGIILEGVSSTGAKPGFAKPAMITTDVAAAIKGAQVLLVVVPAFAQEVYMRIIAKEGEKGQIVVFNPGKFGSLAFAKILREEGRSGDFLIGETSSLIYAAKTRGLGHVNIKAVKSELPFAALPSVRTGEALWILMDLYPQFCPAFGVLQTSVDAPGMIIHPISTLMNMSRIEQIGPYRNSHYDITASVARIMERVDHERMEIAHRFCRETYSLVESMHVMYKVKGESVHDTMYQISAHNVQMAPENLQHRYVTEDIPFGLVTVASIGTMLGIPTPGMDAIIEIASMANDVDYRATGRTAEKLGIRHMSIQALVEYTTHGTVS
ncbi:MAG TPA: NAD/NADP octopine/nopaline dehydrogenase family protein [bacterium]|nr:NAD/NADP octopine/nopaline dehydrogenase family protein [bacterium]HQQ00527.1 NAD/NADP octopine/nopaline dehydrogenase family protein [bacterium]